jgi:hypothetical protein
MNDTMQEAGLGVPMTRSQAQRELARLDLIDRPLQPSKPSAASFFVATMAVLACWIAAAVLAGSLR